MEISNEIKNANVKTTKVPKLLSALKINQLDDCVK
jgi:hypothetical protein